MQIQFKYIYPNLCRCDTQFVPSGNVKSITCKFSLYGIEDGALAKGVFMRDGKSWHVVLDNGVCTLPYEVCQEPGRFLCGVLIERGETIETSTLCSVNVCPGADIHGSNPGKPTATELEQLYELISRLGARLIGASTTEQLDTLCENQGMVHLFVWLSNTALYHSQELKGGGVYAIQNRDSGISIECLYSLCGPVGESGPEGPQGAQGEPGIRFGNFASSGELSLWTNEVDRHGGSGVGLATGDFSYTYSGGTLNISRGDIVRYDRLTYTVPFNILSSKKWTKLAQGTLESEATTISCGATHSPATSYQVYLFVPASTGSRHIECLVGSQSIGKLTSVPATSGCMLRIDCRNSGIWTEDITYYQSATCEDFDDYRNNNISFTQAQKFWHFCGKNSVSTCSTVPFSIKSSTPFPPETRYEIWTQTI